MKNQDLIAGLVDEFYSQIRMEKTAADATNPDGSGDKDKKSPQGHTSEEIANAQSGQNSRGAEMTADVEARTDMPGEAQTAQNAAPTAAGDGYTHPQDGENPNELDADEPPKQEAADKFKQEENNMIMTTPSEVAKVARAERLAPKILRYIAAMQSDDGVQKQAAEQAPQTSGISKEAAEQLMNADPAAVEAFLEFNAGFQRGIEKKAQDMAEVVESGVAPSDDEAAALLDAVAMEDPEAVLPEEAQPEAMVDEESAAIIEELADAMVAEGVTPEDLAEAAAVVGDLQAEGVPPEAILAEVENMAAEEEAAATEKVATETRQHVRERLNKMFGGY